MKSHYYIAIAAFLLGNIASLATVYTTNKLWQDKKTTITDDANAKNDLYKSIAAFDKDRVLDAKAGKTAKSGSAKSAKSGSAKSGKGLSMMFDEFEMDFMSLSTMDMSLSMDMSLQSMDFANINSSYRRKHKLTTYALIDAFSDAKSGKGTNPHHKKSPKSGKVMQQNMDMEFGRPNKPMGGSQEETFLLEKYALPDLKGAVGSNCELMKNVMSFCSDEDSVTEDLMGVLTKTVTKALDKMPQGRQLRGIDVVGDKEKVADLLSQLIG